MDFILLVIKGEIVMFSKEKKIYIAFFAVCFFWGTTYLANRIGVMVFPPFLFTGFRFLFAGFIMLIYAYIKRLKFPGNFLELHRISIVGVLLPGATVLVVWAEQYVYSGFASLMIATVPLFTAIMETVIPDRKSLNLKGWAGLILGFIGVILLVSTNLNSEALNIKGIAALILASIMWSSGSVYSKGFKILASPVTNVGIQMFIAGILFTIIGAIIGEFTIMNYSIQGLGALLYLIIFGSIIGYGSYIYVLGDWPASKAGTYAYVNPIVAVFLGWLIMDEMLTINVIISAILILIAIYIVQTSGRRSYKKVSKANTF
jgi:drug/metabolite transporter (DMT)-like permease